MRSFCSGWRERRRGDSATRGSVGIVQWQASVPVTTWGVGSPASAAIAAAVVGDRPSAIGCIPAAVARHCLRIPGRIRSAKASTPSGNHSLSSGRCASNRSRSPACAPLSIRSSQARRPAAARPVHISSTASGAARASSSNDRGAAGRPSMSFRPRERLLVTDRLGIRSGRRRPRSRTTAARTENRTTTAERAGYATRGDAPGVLLGPDGESGHLHDRGVIFDLAVRRADRRQREPVLGQMWPVLS